MVKCAACYSVMARSEASFTSECSHVFHPICVSGHTTCPSCDISWRHTPTFSPASYSSYSPLLPQPARMPLAVDAFHLAPSSLSTCAVCRSFAGGGIGAIFKAECHHTFHLTCVKGSVCPVCTARWAYDVSYYPSRLDDNYVLPPVSFPPALAVSYDDDEPLEPPAPHQDLQDWELVQDAEDGGGGKLVLDAHCEHAAVAKGKPHDSFVVLVRAKAPGAAAASAADEPRAPIDLVTVLDVSGSMKGAKIALLKKAMEFVVDQLGPADRLSVVAFSTDARRVIPLTRMSDTGKVTAKGAITQLLQADDGSFSNNVEHIPHLSFTALLQSVQADRGTNILKGLDEASKVLHGRRHKNAVASVILLSDGHDTYNLARSSYTYVSGLLQTKNYRDVVPRSLLGGEGGRSTPIHTFGFGADHDLCAMQSIAQETGGTYSFIENQAVVHDSFAQCTGGLLSVAAVHEAWISVDCAHPGVRVRDVKSGRYKSGVEAYGRKASVDIGKLDADEERRFMLLVDVPRAGDADDDVTQLIKVTCTYRDTATGQVVTVDVAVQRPVELAKDQQKTNMEVAWEKFRVGGTEDIAEVHAAAVRDVTEAARIIEGQRKAVLQLDRGCLPSGLMSSHGQQRAGSAFMDTVQEEDFTPMAAFGTAAAPYPSPAAMRLAREMFEQRMKEEDFTAMTAFGATAAAYPSPAVMRLARDRLKQRIKEENFTASPTPASGRLTRERFEQLMKEIMSERQLG